MFNRINRMKTSFLLNCMLLAFGVADFANPTVKAGASGTKVNAKTPTATDGDGAGANGAEEKPKRPALTVQSLTNIVSMPPAERKALLDAAGQRAHIGAGTTGKYVTADGKGVTTDKALAKRAQGGKGRLIGQYTPPRPADVVAAEELIRMTRLRWSIEARAKAVQAQAGRKTPLSDEDLLKILREVNAPPSYLLPKASKRLHGRVLSWMREGDDAIKALTGGTEQKVS